MKNISIVVAISTNNAIGKDNQLLWHLPADLKHFKSITTGGTVIMGRKNYESIGKPLPNRKNIVITRQKDLKIDGVVVVNSLEQALTSSDDKEIFILGGADIYKLSLPICEKIYLTKVHQVFNADTFFPEINNNSWEEVDIEHHQADDKNKFAYTFSTLIRK